MMKNGSLKTQATITELHEVEDLLKEFLTQLRASRDLFEDCNEHTLEISLSSRQMRLRQVNQP